MSKEEIREGIISFLKEFAHECEPETSITRNEFGEIEGWCDVLVKYLDSKGVVIKKDLEFYNDFGGESGQSVMDNLERL